MKHICCCQISHLSWSACCRCGPWDANLSRWRTRYPVLRRRTSRSWCPQDSLSSGCPRCAPSSSTSLMKWLMWRRKSFNNSSNGIATFLLRRIGPWCITWCDNWLSKWRPWPTMWHAWGPLTFMPISTTTLRRCSCSRGSQAKRTSWWPLRSLTASTTIRQLGSSFIADLSDLLLLYTKSLADSLVTADQVLANWFPARNLEPKFCTSIPPSPNPMFRSRTWKIVDATIFIWLWMANPNGAAWSLSHNLATTICDNRNSVTATPLAIADAQCVWHGVHLFRERKSRSLDEFSSICCS